MKALMVIIDGLADEKIEQFGFRSTLDYGKHEHLDRIAEQGQIGFLSTCPEGWAPDSMVCIMNLLGVPQVCYPKSRAALELLACGDCLQDREVVLRCNLLAVDAQEKVVSFNGGGLSPEEMASAADMVKNLEPGLRFIHLSDYRNLIVLSQDLLATVDLPDYPPHENLDKNINFLTAKIFAASPTLRNFVLGSREVLRNLRRGGRQYLFYPWGLAAKTALPSFAQMYRCQGGAVGAAEIVKGLALALRMRVPDLKGVTADVDTDLRAKAQTACRLLEDCDFVLVHVNGADEASHRCDPQQKASFLERIDRELISYLLAYTTDETRIMICGDHATSPVSGKHTPQQVPFFLRPARGDRKPLLPQGLKTQEVLSCLLAPFKELNLILAMQGGN